jgi:hypothetical protein
LYFTVSAESALGDDHEQHQQRELAELRTPAEQQHRQHDLQDPDDHRGESVAVLVEHAADHLGEQLPVTHERRLRARETRARGIHRAADDQQHEGRERGDLGESMLEHRARCWYHIVALDEPPALCDNRSPLRIAGATRGISGSYRRTTVAPRRSSGVE